MTVFIKVPDSLKNSNFRQFLAKIPGWKLFDAFKPNDIASATLYLSYIIKIKALPVLVLMI